LKIESSGKRGYLVQFSRLDPFFLVVLCTAFAIFLFQNKTLKSWTPIVTVNDEVSEEQKYMTLFSENAFYYYFYKTITDAGSFKEGFKEIKESGRFTFPFVVDATKRFNIWQEVAFAFLYKNIVPRGAIKPLKFYAVSTIFVHAIIPVILFVPLAYSSRSILPGFLCCLLYFLSIKYGTRITYAIALRENLGVPFLLLNLFLVPAFLRGEKKRFILPLFISAFLHSLFWQFSSITLSIKHIALFIFFCRNKERKDAIRTLVIIDFVVYVFLLLIFWGNRFYIAPWYICFLVVSYALSYKHFRGPILNIASFLFLSICMKMALGFAVGSGADSHLLDFFICRLTGDCGFSSMLYMAVGPFRQISLEQLVFFTKSLLLPLFVVAIIINFMRGTESFDSSQKVTGQVYFLFLLGFLALCIMVNRFVIISMPLVAAYSSFILCVQLGKLDGKIMGIHKGKMAIICLCLIVAVAAIGATKRKEKGLNPNSSLSKISRFLRQNTYRGDVIAANMVLSSTFALVTDNNFILHPQFEAAANRERVKFFNRVYGFSSTKRIYDYLAGLNVNYVVLEASKCRTSKMQDAIHHDYPKETSDLFCRRDFTGSPEFTDVYRARGLRILRVEYQSYENF